MKWLVALLLAGCADNTVVVSPVIDVPANDNASAFPLDTLVLAAAHAGDPADLVSQKFKAGQHVSLPGVPFADDLVIHMTGSVGSSEVAYGRTCEISVTASASPPSPHLFFSGSVKFADLDLPTPPEARMNGRAITDVDGAGLIFGGTDPSSTALIADVERFDPQTGTLVTFATLTPRDGAVAASLGVGGDTQIALIGGTDSTGAGATFVELIEPDQPENRRIERIDDAQMARTGLTATALTDGRVIVIGGLDDGGMPSPAVDEVSIDSGSAAIRVLRALLTSPRSAHTATRLGNDEGAAVLVAGGLDATGTPVKTAELFKPLSEEFSTTTYGMNFPRSGHQAVLMPDGSVLIIGGIKLDMVTGMPVPAPTLELFTLDEGFKTLTPDLPANAGLVDFAATPLPDGRVLLTGGRLCEGCAALDTAFIARLDPIDGSVDVVATDHMSVPRAGHSATLLCDGTILITGGTDTVVPATRYNPPALGRR